DADPVTLAAYQSSVEAKAAALDPVLIYLDPGDAGQAIAAITQHRGPAWTEYMIAVVTDCPYAISRELKGMDGATAVIRAYKQLLDESVARCPFPKLELSDCHHGWPDCHTKIRQFLRLPPHRPA